jgi:hypothetical protein
MSIQFLFVKIVLSTGSFHFSRGNAAAISTIVDLLQSPRAVSRGLNAALLLLSISEVVCALFRRTTWQIRGFASISRLVASAQLTTPFGLERTTTITITLGRGFLKGAMTVRSGSLLTPARIIRN